MMTVVLSLGLVLALALLAPLMWQRFETWAVSIHQRSTTRELADWEQDYSKIDSVQKASRAIDMLDYIQTYYVPGSGYRGDPDTEKALESQRKHTLSAIVEALERFSGERNGSDLSKWQAWRERERPR
jgi:hypothetical protein